MAGYVGSGILYGGEVGGPLFMLGNCRKFAITENATIKKRISKMTGTYGQVLDSASTKEPAKLAIELDDWDEKNLRDAGMGTILPFDQSAGTDTAREFNLTTVVHGGIYELGKRRVSEVEVAVASTVKTLGVDYEIVDAEMGFIRFLTAIGSTGTATVTFDHAAVPKGTIIQGGTDPTIKRRYVLVGENQVDRTRWEVEAFEAVMKPTSELDYLADDYSVLGFEGEMNTPAGKASPYEIRTFPAAA